MDQNNLIARCEKLLHELGISKTSFCKRIDLSTSAYYVWKSGTLKLAEETEGRISNFLEGFGF